MSQFWPNFTTLTQFHNFDQISQFQPNFTILAIFQLPDKIKQSRQCRQCRQCEICEHCRKYRQYRLCRQCRECRQLVRQKRTLNKAFSLPQGRFAILCVWKPCLTFAHRKVRISLLSFLSFHFINCSRQGKSEPRRRFFRHRRLFCWCCLLICKIKIRNRVLQVYFWNNVLKKKT